ncbi:MAG: ribosome small subunit-dependent GTPase A [Planctomycetales bacterium]|nr:ribosome small subunit-dependent GTPase A [Planctomycetales bacterium]MCA9236323.1 ribosome small subunit-dependent GTPase A [Planctomycetales bacterium]
MAKKKHKVRADFRKNRTVRTRQKDLTRNFVADDATVEDLDTHQSVTGKGDLTRKRTLAGAEISTDASGTIVLPEIDKNVCRRGRVLRVQGLVSVVQQEDGTTRQCATRRLLKSLSTDQRHVVVAGDIVWVRPEGAQEGIIERIEPRRGVLSRTSRQRQHVLVTNVDQVLIVASAAEPRLKPNLLDRYLVTAERAAIEPVLCINKVDLVDPADLQPLVGVYSQLGYRVLLLSATKGWGIRSLRNLLRDRETALTGQSGVGKSSLLNALEPGLELRVQSVSNETEKGRHTTTTAELIPLSSGGYVVDTPGIRQFQLWDVIPAEVAGFFRDLRPYVSHCRYPDCTHTHEEPCAVKDAVADGYIDVRRYESYLQIHAGDEA